MNKERNIESYFDGVLENIDIILKNDFYQNKETLKDVRIKIDKWYNTYKSSGSLKNIDPQELKDIDLEITTIFADYVATEPVKENYTERLSYDFGHLERYWKDEMLGGERNVR